MSRPPYSGEPAILWVNSKSCRSTHGARRCEKKRGLYYLARCVGRSSRESDLAGMPTYSIPAHCLNICGYCNFSRIRALWQICCIELKPVPPLMRRPYGLIRQGKVFCGHGSSGEMHNVLRMLQQDIEPLANRPGVFICASMRKADFEERLSPNSNSIFQRLNW